MLDIPYLYCVVLACRNKEIRFFGSKTYTCDIFSM